MKYYLYVSDRKVDMLLAQIPKRLKRRIASEVKVDLKLISATLTSTTQEETRYSKLVLVQNYLEREQQVGTVELPGTYLRGVMPMRWGLAHPHNMVLFGGCLGQTTIALCGSPEHVIGAAAGGATIPDREIPLVEDFSMRLRLSPSAGPQMISILAELAEVAQRDKPRWSVSQFGDIGRLVLPAVSNMQGPQWKLEFLAKRVAIGRVEPSVIQKLTVEVLDRFGFSGESPKPHQIVLGTPLYVAQVD